MRKLIGLVLLTICGCTDQTVYHRYGESILIGSMGPLDNNIMATELHVITIEGHHYYAYINNNAVCLGPEVPSDSWENISDRIKIIKYKPESDKNGK